MDKRSKTRKDAERYSHSDDDYEKRIHGLISRMSKNIEIKIPEKFYPHVRVTSLNSCGYDENKNVIYISQNKINSGVSIGEEIGHFFRDFSLKNKPSEESDFRQRYTGEFFGFLGSKILERVSESRDRLDFNYEYVPYNLKVIVPNLKKAKKELKRLIKNYNEGKYPERKTLKNVKKRIGNLISYRLDVLQHQRPYYFASKVDINKLNLQKLYEIGNKEIRERFFREDPQYDFRKPIKPAKITKRKCLESVIKIATPLFLIALFITISKKIITGNFLRVNFSQNSFQQYLLLIIIVLLVGFSIFYHLKKKCVLS